MCWRAFIQRLSGNITFYAALQYSLIQARYFILFLAFIQEDKHQAVSFCHSEFLSRVSFLVTECSPAHPVVCITDGVVWAGSGALTRKR